MEIEDVTIKQPVANPPVSPFSKKGDKIWNFKSAKGFGLLSH